MAERHGSKTLSRPRQVFEVAPSPLNGVKLDFAIILIVGGLLLLVVARISDNAVTQVLVLLAYGLLGMVWVVIRVRLVARAIERSVGRDGSQQE